MSHRTERYDLGVVELRTLIGAWGDSTPDRIRTMLTQFEVLALGSDQRYDRLQEALESYISQLDANEQAVYRDLSHVAPPDELKTWEAASVTEREALWRTFWNERDANAATIENERLVEHYRRVMYARIHFSEKQYPYDRRGEPLVYAFDAVSFRGDDGTTEVDLSYSVPVWQFGDVTDERGDRTWLDNQVTLRDSVHTPAFSRKFRFGPIARPERQPANQELQGAAYTLAVNLAAPAGPFTAAVEMKDEATQRIGVYKKPVSFSDYRGSGLLISDLKLSTEITPASGPGPFVRKELNVVPNPGRLYARGQLVHVYYEVYNLDVDEGGRTSYETLYEITPMGMPPLRNRRARRPVDMQTVMSFFEGEGNSAEEGEYTALDTTDLEAGEYVLTVTLTDRHQDVAVSKSVNFMVLEP